MSVPTKCGRKQPEHALELWWTGIQNGLAGGEEVGLASILLLDDLCSPDPA